MYYNGVIHVCQHTWRPQPHSIPAPRAAIPLTGATGAGPSPMSPTGFPARRITSIVPTTRGPIGQLSGPFVAQGNNAGNNDELASFHPGGVNVLMGDGSVRFLKDSVSPVTLRALVTPQGGEVISSDSY